MSLVIAPVEVNVIIRKIDTLLRKFADEKNYAGWRLEQFEDSLINSHFNPEALYGRYLKDAVVLKFFNGDENAERNLRQIRDKNEAEGHGNKKVPGTGIELINYSVCPNCKEIFSFKQVQEYFTNPAPMPEVDRHDQLLHDTRVRCHICHTYFISTLVICKGAPTSEVQGLCRVQTVHLIEEACMAKGKRVLTRNRQNIRVDKDGKRSIVNDVYIEDLKDKPGLIANLIYHTPDKLAWSFINAKNIPNKDLLFGIRV